MLSYRGFEQAVQAAMINKYGNNPPVPCRLRLETELEIFRKTKSYEDIPLLNVLFRLAEEDGSEITGHGYGSPLAARIHRSKPFAAASSLRNLQKHGILYRWRRLGSADTVLLWKAYAARRAQHPV